MGFFFTPRFVLINVIVIFQCFSLPTFAQDFDFFYFVQNWPGSYCDTERSCCYPRTGKPSADFKIHGLWPNYNDGTYPSNCDPSSPFDRTQISDLVSSMEKNWPSLACPSSDNTKFWSHEWNKHGTCSESVLDQYEYFETTLNLKAQANILQALQTAGINPDGSHYSLDKIKSAIEEGIKLTPGISCNVDGSGNSQLYEIYLCVDSSASNFIDCPVFPNSNCASSVEFPKF
ncbi:hypothetical protein IC582_023059 [Cucumis melo]|uniref:Ribonuclease 1-like n=3 Tax=Cucumis melo TaxID=3656 RepID=A0A1S3BEV8_CUCME|nr:ribonuclease 1-like [Cucumis melo]KAA0034420.1 ribonuclease 1-like [Cucumis melo var. makuwa]